MSEIGSATFGLVVGLGRFRRGLEDAEREAKQSGEKVGEKFTDESTDEIEGSGSRWSGALEKLAPVIVAAGAALGALAVVGLMQGIEAEAASSKLAAQMGLDPAEAEMAGHVAGDLYASAYGESLEDVHAAVGAVGSTLTSMAAENAEDLERLSRKALDFAEAFDVDVSRAVNSAGILLRSGLVDDADEAFDLIVAASQQMPAHMREELLEASDEYSQFFAALGISGEEAFGMLVRASEDGMYGIDKTGDALKELTIRATDMSTASVEAYEAAGLSAADMSAAFLAGGDEASAAFDMLIDGLLGIEDPVEQANAAIALFGTPLEDLGTSEIPTFLSSLDSMDDALGDVEGAADRMGDTLNDNARTEIETFKRQALQGLGDFAMRYAIPALRSLSGFITGTVLPAVRGVSDWARENQTVLVAVGIGIMATLVPAFVAWAIAAGTAAVATLTAIAPLIAVGAAVGALAYLVLTHWETIRTATSTVVSWITTRFDTVVGFFTGLPGRIASAAGNMWSWIGDTLRGALQSVANLWNNFRFPAWTMPSVSIPGIGSIGGATIGGWSLPRITVPALALGGTAVLPGLALVGERGPELLHMPTGASVVPLDRVGADGFGGGPDVIQLVVDGRVLAEIVRDHDDDRNRRNGRAA